MKRLFLLRHAQAMPAQGHADAERTLSAHGKMQSIALGTAMATQNYKPDFCYCSNAIRTRQTHEGVAQNLSFKAPQFSRDIYHGGAGDYLDIIQKTPNEHQSLLLIGHNPSIYELAVRLCKEEGSDSESLRVLMSGYKPATLSVIDCDIENWADIQVYENMLINLLDPSAYCPE